MFKLHKHKSGKGGGKFDFQFSDFQAIKVPKGWDKLFVSLVSVETGKTYVKSGKSSVRNGMCRWTETFHESVSILQEKGITAELEGCLFRFVVAMGSSRSGVLGEVTINLADYTSSRASVPVSFLLKKCNYGTSLQFKIQCLTPKTKDRGVQEKYTNSHFEDGIDDMEIKSDASKTAFSRSAASLSGNHLESMSTSQASLSRDPSLSASDSRHSYDSLEVSSGNDMLSPQNNMFGPVSNLIMRQDSIGSQNSVPSCSFRATDENRSNHSSIRSRTAESSSPCSFQEEQNSSSFVSPPCSNAGSSKYLLETAEVTIEELRAEARMWERNAKKSTLDLEVLRNEMYEQSRSQSTLCMELSASQQECSDLKQEVEHQRILLEELAKKHDATADLRLQDQDMDKILKEMEGEIRFQKESNADLTEQLQKTQESNIELLSILQELEAIIETQKSEIEALSSLDSKLQESGDEGLPEKKELLSDFNVEASKDTQPTQDLDEHFPEGIDNIKLQLQQLQETQEELESSIRLLEKSVEDKDNEIERERDLRTEVLLDSESKWKLQLAAKEEEIMNLEAKLSEAVQHQRNKNFEVEIGDETDLTKEMMATDLQFLLPNVNFSSSPPNNLSYFLFEMRKLLDQTLNLTKEHGLYLDIPVDCNCIFTLNDLEMKGNEPLAFDEQLHAILDSLSKINECFEIQCNRCREMFMCLKVDAQEELNLESGTLKECENHIHNQGHGNFNQLIHPDLGKELEDASTISALKSDNLRKEEDIEALKKLLSALEDQMASVRDDNLLLQEKTEVLEREKSSSSEYIDEMKKEIMMLSSSVESHISASKVLERLSSELGKGKEDLEQQMSDLEKENMQLSERISALEAQLRYIMDEKETCLLDLRHSESQSMMLRDEIRRLEIEIDTQKVDVRQKVQGMQNRWLEAQEECEYLKKANLKLQSTAENLIEECTTLQKFNGELKRQNLELNKQCTVLESQLRETQLKFAECSGKIEALEEEYCMIVEEVSLKVTSLNSELESLVVANREHLEKVMQENVSLNDMYMKKVVEVENLQTELVHLIDQISVAHHEKETVTPDAIFEVSVLRSDKAKLEVSLEELTGKFALSQSKLSILEAETEAKVHQLTTLRKSHEVLMSNYDNLLVAHESLKNSEEKHKSVINGLEINLKASNYEGRLLAEEISSLKEQLQRAILIQAEVLDLKTSLREARFEYERVKASYDLLRGDYDELRTEKESLLQKTSTMQKSLLELEDYQRCKIALEEKILRLEGDLAAREALCAQDAELKIELSKIKRANGELQRKIKYLEQDQEASLKRVQVLQDQLWPKSQAMDNQMNSVGKPGELDEKQGFEMPGVQNSDYLSKIQYLENELAEALEANDMYKCQLRRFLSDEENCSDTPKISGSNNESDGREQGINMSYLEVELKDLRERYFQMSLKYAEVEAQRAELVLKLKTTNNRRSWFS